MLRNKNVRLAIGIGLLPLGLVFSGSLAAKDKQPLPRPQQIQNLYNCRDISNSTERLVCYDREVGGLQTADTNREITFADKETITKTRRGLFGFSLPKLGIFGGDDDEDEVKHVETTVRSASADGFGRIRIEMADESVWVQTDNKIMPLRPRPGQKIEIKSASLGTYFLSVEGRPSIRVRRER